MTRPFVHRRRTQGCLSGVAWANLFARADSAADTDRLLPVSGTLETLNTYTRGRGRGSNGPCER